MQKKSRKTPILKRWQENCHLLPPLSCPWNNFPQKIALWKITTQKIYLEYCIHKIAPWKITLPPPLNPTNLPLEDYHQENSPPDDHALINLQLEDYHQKIACKMIASRLISPKMIIFEIPIFVKPSLFL